MLQQEIVSQQQNKEKLLKELTEIALYTDNIEIRLKKFAIKLADTLNVKRVIIGVTEPYTKKIFVISNLNKKNDKYLLSEENAHMSEFWQKKFAQDSSLINISKIENSNLPQCIKKSYKEIGIKSILAKSICNETKYFGGILFEMDQDINEIEFDKIDLMYSVANQLFLILERYTLSLYKEKQLEKESLIKDIVVNINKSFDINEIEHEIVYRLGKFLKADRVFISEFDFQSNKFLPVRTEYLSSNKMKSIAEFFVSNDVEHFNEIFLNKQGALLADAEKYHKEHKLKNTVLDTLKNHFQVESGVRVPVIYDDVFLGSIGLHSKKKNFFNEEDFEFVKIVANHAGLAIYKTKLLQKERQAARREFLLRRIIEASEKAPNIKKVKQAIISEIGKAFNADRCYLRKYSKISNNFLKIEDEYRSSDKISSIINKEANPEVVDYFIDNATKEKSSILMKNTKKYIQQQNLQGSSLEKYLNKTSSKSYYTFPVWDREDNIIFLSLHYVKKMVNLNKEDIELLKLLASQAANAIDHSKLYKETEERAQREKLLREMVISIRSTIDKHTLKPLFVKTIGDHFKADRVFYSEFDKETNMYLPVDKYSEYLSSPNEKSFIGHDWSSPGMAEYINPLIDKQEFNIPNLDEYLGKNKKSKSFVHLFKDADVQSSYNIPVLYGNKILGYFCIEFTQREHRFDKEELGFIRSICDQTAIALQQSELFETVKQKAQREKLLREVIQNIRNTFDIDEIKNYFVNLIGEYFGADRVGLSQFDLQKKVFLPFDNSSEYLANPNYMSFVNYDWSKEEIQPFIKTLLDGKEVNFSDLDTYVKEKELEKTCISELFELTGVASSYNIPILYGKDIFGYFCIDFNKKGVVLSEDDLNFVRTIANQAGIAFYQSNLYAKSQKNALREKFLSEIISTVKSTLDINEILTLLYHKVMKFYDFKEIISCEHLIKNCKTIYGADLDKRIADKRLIVLRDKLCKKNKNLGEIKIEEVNDDELNIRQTIIVPLMLQGFKLGNIHLFSENRKIWEKEDLNLFEKIADNIAIAIRDSSLYTKTKFMADVSHELKTPVAIIDAYARNLLNKSEYSPETVESYLSTIKHNTFRITNIIENLLTLSRLEQDSSCSTVKNQKIKIHKIIDNILQMQKISASKKNINIEVYCDKKLSITVNEVLMEQALLNLVKNAIQYSHNGSKIIVKAEKVDDEIYISVQDFGCGIERQNLKEIFKRFYRVDKSRSRDTGGTGLGLSITQKIVEVYKGRVKVESVLGKGSKFTLILP